MAEEENDKGYFELRTRTRYEGKSISRYRDEDLSKGDIGWKPWSEIEPTILRVRFYLEDVVWWEEYHGTSPMIVPGKSIIHVEIVIEGSSTNMYIVEDLDVFDHLMERIENGID